MHGVGRASGAITFVNALPTGIGSAAAIMLGVEADVEIEPSVRSSITIPASNDTPLVRASVAVGVEQFFPGRLCSVRVRIRSSIPPARGLKSSSAVSGAVLASVANAAGAPIDPILLARLSADLSQEIGLSATGAFDDAVAALGGGAVVTDNALRSVLWTGDPPPGVEVLLWIPGSPHPPSVEWRERFHRRAAEGSSAVNAALAGDLVRAMKHNTELVESVMGYDYGELRAELTRRGATASGVSGLGPTLAALVPRERANAARAVLSSRGGEVRTVAFRARAESIVLENGA